MGQEDSISLSKRKTRYKHFEQLDDSAIMTRSIVKAHNDVKNSSKMRAYKAIPSIATGIIATSLALTQPGKLSAKAAVGLGFLALSAGIDGITEAINSHKNKTQDEKSKTFALLGGITALGAGALALAKGMDNGKAFNGIKKFFSKEASKLSEEINSTKLANFTDKHINPFIEKHPYGALAGAVATTAITGIASGIASNKLMLDISEDIKNKATDNFKKAKTIQQIAREHFDSIDAVEV